MDVSLHTSTTVNTSLHVAVISACLMLKLFTGHHQILLPSQEGFSIIYCRERPPSTTWKSKFQSLPNALFHLSWLKLSDIWVIHDTHHTQYNISLTSVNSLESPLSMSQCLGSPFGAGVSCPACGTELNELMGVWGVCPRCNDTSYWIGDPSLRNRQTVGATRGVPRYETPAPTSPTIPLSPPAEASRHLNREPRKSTSEAATEETPGPSSPRVTRWRQSGRRLRTRHQMRQVREGNSVSESPEVTDSRTLPEDQPHRQPRTTRRRSRRIPEVVRSGEFNNSGLRTAFDREGRNYVEGEEVRSESPEVASTNALLAQNASTDPADDDELYAAPSPTQHVTTSLAYVQEPQGPVNEATDEPMDEAPQSSASDIPVRAPPDRSTRRRPRQTPSWTDPPRGASSETRTLLRHARQVHWVIAEQTRMLNSVVRELERGVNDGTDERFLLYRRRSVEGQLQETAREIRRVRELIREVAGSFLIRAEGERSPGDANQAPKTQRGPEE
jgi:hypothetical protein